MFQLFFPIISGIQLLLLPLLFPHLSQAGCISRWACRTLNWLPPSARALFYVQPHSRCDPVKKTRRSHDCSVQKPPEASHTMLVKAHVMSRGTPGPTSLVPWSPPAWPYSLLLSPLLSALGAPSGHRAPCLSLTHARPCVCCTFCLKHYFLGWHMPPPSPLADLTQVSPQWGLPSLTSVLKRTICQRLSPTRFPAYFSP